VSEPTRLRERFASALERLDGDLELLSEMATVTVPDCPAAIERVQEALDESDTERAARSLHKLKGMLSTFDSEGVVLEIQETMELARRDAVEETRSLFAKQRPKLEALVRDIKELSAVA
jgi:HPt (histidine-containing phosphotransfer) domain-containing protein